MSVVAAEKEKWFIIGQLQQVQIIFITQVQPNK